RRGHSKAQDWEGVRSMATCPVCNHDVATPSFLNLDAWRWLVGPNCKARLEMKSPRSFLLSLLMAPLFVLRPAGPRLRGHCLRVYVCNDLPCATGKRPS